MPDLSCSPRVFGDHAVALFHRRARAADLDRDCARAHAQNHRRLLGDLFQLVVKRALKAADVKDSLAQGDWC